MALHVCLDPEKVMINRNQLSQELNQPFIQLGTALAKNIQPTFMK